MRRYWLLVGLVFGLCILTPAVYAATSGPAEGTFLQVRMPVTSGNSLITSSLAVPEFVIGVRKPGFEFGVGLGMCMDKASQDATRPANATTSTTAYENMTDYKATIFEIAPQVAKQIWKSPDGNTVANFIGILRFGKISLNVTNTYTSGGTTTTNEVKPSGTLMGFGLGVGADHYLGSNFALGLEVGLDGNYAKVTQDPIAPSTTTNEYKLNSTMLYGALKLTVVL